ASLFGFFEPRRHSKVQHWSGTNEYPPYHQHKLGSTLNASSHAYLLSLDSMIFCDLQTATIVNENGDGIQVLVNAMTHTLDGSSGVGDHGKTGIQTFLKKHECVTIVTISISAMVDLQRMCSKNLMRSNSNQHT
ncbi:hypothetical protein B0H14DRAFT_2417782, partial [Mycena olivaceomarginata]